MSERSVMELLSSPIKWLNAMTLRSAARAIGPSEAQELDGHVCAELEAQLSRFPVWHRVGFRLGLLFLELGAPLGAWGLTPFSLLSRERAGRRFERLMHSALPPVRLFSHSLKMLVCLSVYGHPEVEARFGAPRRAWRESRVALRDALVSISDPQRAPSPARLSDQVKLAEADYLSFDAHQRIQGGSDEPK